VTDTRGFTLLEVLVAVTILGVALVTVLGLHARNIRLTAQTQDLTMAAMLGSCLTAVTRTSATLETGISSGTFDERDLGGFDLAKECRGPYGDRYLWERDVGELGDVAFSLPRLRRVSLMVGTEAAPELAEFHFLVRQQTP
jgi:prepilin-type N-terminal cleavage/methylation domain-containing protein